MKSILCFAVSLPLFLTLELIPVAAGAAEAPVTAKSFAGSDQRFTRFEAALYLAHRDKTPLSALLEPGQTTLNQKKVVEAMADRLDDLEDLIGHPAPWATAEMDKALPPGKTKDEKESELPAWKTIEGFTKVKKVENGNTGGSFGPIQIRKSSEELSKGLKDAKGATLGFNYNRLLPGSGAWNSQGILRYPFLISKQGGPGKSIEFQFGPAVEWKLAQTQETTGKDIEELAFSIPTTVYISPGKTYPALWVAQAKPYFHTDFAFDHEIFGVEASLEYVGAVFGGGLYMGGFQNIGASGLQYQLRLVPRIDYSTTERTGPHTTRKHGDDWFRLGGFASLDIRLGGQSFNPLDVGVSYQLMETVSGTGDYSDLFKAHATWWLSENLGLILEYAKGETPVADKDIDLLTLGLEFKY